MHGNEIMNKLIIHSNLVSSFRSTCGIHWEWTGGGRRTPFYPCQRGALVPGVMAAWVLPVSLHENWKKGKTTTQRAMERHSSEGRGANSNPSPWGLRWSHSITCFHSSGHITVPGAEASGMSSYGSMDLPPYNLLLPLVLSGEKKTLLIAEIIWFFHLRQ